MDTAIAAVFFSTEDATEFWRAETAMRDRPDVAEGSRVTIHVDRRGATLYCNTLGLRAIAEQLHWIAESAPEDHVECHLRLHLDGMANEKVRLVITDDVRPFYELPREAGLEPCGFEVTFMHVADDTAAAI